MEPLTFGCKETVEQIYEYVAACCLIMMLKNRKAIFMVHKVQLKKGISARLSRG